MIINPETIEAVEYNITVVEGCMYAFNICFDENDPISCTSDCQAVLTIENEDKRKYTSDCAISNNSIKIIIPPSSTLHQDLINYEVRLFTRDGGAYPVVYGKIEIKQSINPDVKYPFETEVNSK